MDLLFITVDCGKLYLQEILLGIKTKLQSMV